LNLFMDAGFFPTMFIGFCWFAKYGVNLELESKGV